MNILNVSIVAVLAFTTFACGTSAVQTSANPTRPYYLIKDGQTVETHKNGVTLRDREESSSVWINPDNQPKRLGFEDRNRTCSYLIVEHEHLGAYASADDAEQAFQNYAASFSCETDQACEPMHANIELKCVAGQLAKVASSK